MSSFKKPKLVWLISSLYFLAFLFVLLACFLSISHTIEMPELQNYLANQPPLELTLKALAAVLVFCAAFALFFLKRIAFVMFLSSLFVNLLLQLSHVLLHNWSAVFANTNIVSICFGWGWLLFVCFYSWHLRKKGVLN